MPTSLQRQEFKKYEQKIADLHGELERVSREVASLGTERDHLKEEVFSLQKAKETAGQELAKAEGQRIRHAGTMARQESMAAEATRRFVKTREGHSAQLAGFAQQKVAIVKEVAKLNGELALAKKKSLDLSKLNRQIASAQKELERLNARMSKDRKAIVIELASLMARRAEVKELIEKNSEIRTAFERDRATFEIYVRRLQRYYSKVNINIDVLSQFGVVRDSQ